jgi:DNA-binding NarL/FixJ family response regulator
MTSPIRVLVADDHPMVRTGLRLVLERRGDICVLAEAADGREAVELAIRDRPDVVLVDLDMPRLSGVRVIAELRRQVPSARCLVLTMHEDDAYLFDALEAGAAGFLVKGAGSEDIERAVRAAAAGQIVLAPEVAARFQAAMSAGRPRKGGRALQQLTDRELDLLDLLAAGADNVAIASRLHLAPKTVRNLVSALLVKLAVPDRGEAMRVGRAAGLGRR